MKRLRLALMRHLPTDWNAQGRLQGHLDIPLSAESRGRVPALVARARELPLCTVWSSDLIRAVHTANPIALDQRLCLRTDPRLREFHMGALEGLRKDVARSRYPASWHSTKDPAFDCGDVGGDSRALVCYRVLEAVRDLFRRYADGEQSPMVAIVSHAGALRVLLQALDIDYRVTHGQWQIVHLSQDQLRGVNTPLPEELREPY